MLAVSDLEREAQAWLLDCEIRQLSKETLALRRVLVTRFNRFLNENGHTQVDTEAVRAFFHHLTERKLRPKSIKNYYVDLSCLFRYLQQEGIVRDNPFDAVSRPKVPVDQIQPFTPAQVKALLAAAKHSRNPRRDEALMLFLFDTGARASEACGLTVADMDISNRRCRVLGKGNKFRTLPFSAVTARALIRYLAEMKREPTDPVFLSERGGAMGRYGLLEVFRRLGETAQIEGTRCSPHTARHTAAITFLRSGGNLFALKELLGHRELRMVSVYAALAQADVEAQHQQHSPIQHILGGGR